MSHPEIYVGKTSEELARDLRVHDACDVMLMAQEHLRLGNYTPALNLCGAAELRGLLSPALELCRAQAQFALGNEAAALAGVEAVLERVPAHLPALYYKAQMLRRRDLGQAMALLLRIIDSYPDYPGAFANLASLAMPGPYYRDVLGRIHELAQPATYLEIGVETGATLALARTAEIALGVDPDASALRCALLGPNMRVLELTSDAFFARYTPHSVFGGRPVDLVYIDGLHLYENALRDFAHAEAWCRASSAIILHDCVAVVPIAATRERRSKFWVGDTWKVAEILSEYRPELKLSLILTPPSGLLVVQNLDPSSRRLLAAWPEIEAAYREREYPYPALSWPEFLHRIPNTEAGLRKLFPRPGAGS